MTARTPSREYLSNVSQIQDSSTNQLTAYLNTMPDPHLKPIEYRGVTEDDTPTEIFIDAEPEFRLQPPANSVIYVPWYGAAYNSTLGVGDTHGNVAAGAGNFTVRRAGVNTALVGAASGSGFVFTVDDTNDWVVCTVTGVAASRIIWRCFIIPVSASNAFPYHYGDQTYDGNQ